jgi:large subunit ribosomal protein L20
MPRAKGGFKTRKRRRKLLEKAKGYYGAKSRLFRVATEAVDKAMQYAYRDRKNKKREFRALWITRITQEYAPRDELQWFMARLKKADIA